MLVTAVHRDNNDDDDDDDDNDDDGNNYDDDDDGTNINLPRRIRSLSKFSVSRTRTI